MQWKPVPVVQMLRTNASPTPVLSIQSRKTEAKNANNTTVLRPVRSPAVRHLVAVQRFGHGKCGTPYTPRPTQGEPVQRFHPHGSTICSTQRLMVHLNPWFIQTPTPRPEPRRHPFSPAAAPGASRTSSLELTCRAPATRAAGARNESKVDDPVGTGIATFAASCY